MVKEIHGKLMLEASTILMPLGKRIDAEVYVHLKGYARAGVSHVDIEKMGLGKIIRRGRGNFLEIRGVERFGGCFEGEAPDNFGWGRGHGFKHSYSLSAH